MNVEISEELSDAIRGEVLRLCDSLVESGWEFGSIRWVSVQARTLSIAVKSPTGENVYVMCDEPLLAQSLQQLLNRS